MQAKPLSQLCAILLVTTGFLHFFPTYLHSGEISNQKKSWIEKASRHEKNGWIYLHVEGEPRERGFQHGYLLAREIVEAVCNTGKSWRYGSGMDWDWLVAQSHRMMNPKVDAENMAEIDGMVEGVIAAGRKTTRDEMIAYNAIIELAGYWWPEAKKKGDINSPTPKKDACSSFIAVGAATADGGVVLGHNTMSGYNALYNVILDIMPAKGHRILMQAQPGWVHSGTDFFITDAGLVGSETTIGDFHGFNEKGIPEFVRMRRATQDASSIEQWCDIMKKGNNGGYANAWLIGDVNKNEIARLELGLKFTSFEKTKDGFYVGSNVAEDLKILRFETSTDDADIRLSSVARRVRWKSLMKQYIGKLDAELAKQLESDHYDSYLKIDNACGRSLCAHYDLDDKKFSPGIPFLPAGTCDAKVVDSKMAKKMSFSARWGSACGTPFDAPGFLDKNPQFDSIRDILISRPSQPWTTFYAGEDH